MKQATCFFGFVLVVFATTTANASADFHIVDALNNCIGVKSKVINDYKSTGDFTALLKKVENLQSVTCAMSEIASDQCSTLYCQCVRWTNCSSQLPSMDSFLECLKSCSEVP